MRSRFLAVIAGTVLAVTACEEKTSTPPPEHPGLSSELSSRCFHWPSAEFTRTNMADALASLAVGDQAVDFELATVDGARYRLSNLLFTRPVLLVLGSYT